MPLIVESEKRGSFVAVLRLSLTASGKVGSVHNFFASAHVYSWQRLTAYGKDREKSLQLFFSFGALAKAFSFLSISYKAISGVVICLTISNIFL